MTMKRIKVILLILVMLFPLHQTIYSQTQMLWSKPSFEENNFNQNQYQCPIWVTYDDLFNVYPGIHSVIIRDINNDGYCDVFFSFYGWDDNNGGENEKIPFMLLFYNPISGELEDNSNLISNNVGQTFNRKSVSADFNGDGVLDFINVSHPEKVDKDLSHLDIVLSNQSGWEQFNLSTVNRYNDEGYYHGVSVGDIDNDNDIDFVVAQWHNSDGMVSYLNDGDGNFTTTLSIPNTPSLTDNSSFTVELEDINNDECLDLIYWGDGSGIAYGNCDGTFGNIQKLIFGSFGYFMDYDFTDFDNDGDKDLIITETNYNDWGFLFLENTGIDEDEKVIFIDVSESVNEDLITQNFYLDESSKNWNPYIQLVDLNNDGIKDIIKTYPFEGSQSNSYLPQNWILFGKENLKFDYFNYPILTPISEIYINKDFKESEINWKTTHLTNVINPFSEEMIMENLRGEIKDWIVYYRQTPWGDKNLEGVKRITFPHNEILKDPLGNNTFSYKVKFQPEFEGNNDIYFRITYVDTNGIENPLSPQNNFSVEDFDYDDDGIPNVTDQCPDTPSGETVNTDGCSENPLSVDIEILDNSLKIYPNPLTNILTIESKNISISKVEIYTILGKKIKEVTSNLNHIATDYLPNGLYLIKIYSEKGMVMKKTIKM